MLLELQQILPTYFETSRAEKSGVWGKTLRWEQGRKIKIVAPSGSGKTSLISFLYGLRKDYHGRVLWGSTNMQDVRIEEMAVLRQQHISVVFQDLRLFPEQTVFENIEIKRQLHPFHEKEKIAEMAARLGLNGKLDRICKTCSYGEQQRVAIIRALMQPFEFLLLDEPFSHLDNANSEIAMQLMLEEASVRKASIIFADLERVDFFPFDEIYHL